MDLYTVFRTRCIVITMQTRGLHPLWNICMITSNMHAFHAALMSSQTKNIHAKQPDSNLLLKSPSNNSEDYSFLKLETWEAFARENHYLWVQYFTAYNQPVTKKPRVRIADDRNNAAKFDIQHGSAAVSVYAAALCKKKKVLYETDTRLKNIKHKGIIVSGAVQQYEDTLHTGVFEPLGHSWEMQRCRFFFRLVITLIALRLSQTIPAGTALN